MDTTPATPLAVSSSPAGRSLFRRWTMMCAGIALGVAAIAAAPLPVPLEVPLAGGSAVLILRASPRARRLYVRGRRRWPRPFRVSDRVLRRPTRPTRTSQPLGSGEQG
jgi:hypothetical protein